MSEIVQRFEDFVAYRKSLKGDEKGEAQVFCDRLFQAFGHKGYKEAGAELEFRVKQKKASTSFADLVWKPRLLLEMKKSSEKLVLHYQQAFDYWLNLVPNRPRYVVLCNFDEFWIYDFDKQLNEPVDRVHISELPKRYAALNFLFPAEKKPVFGNDLEQATRETADQVADLFQRLIKRGVQRDVAQRFVLQLIVAMFSEDIDLLPSNLVAGIVEDCVSNGQSSYDLFGGLFHQMNSKQLAQGGRYAGVPYFNGGLFAKVTPIDLTKDELTLIGGNGGAASKDWSKVDPVIFGSIFQHSMDAGKRHAFGAHYTHETDIQRIVGPTIVKPWREKIDSAKTVKELVELRTALTQFRVLDPACGSGNFLYVSFRELVRLETRLILRMKELASSEYFKKNVKSAVLVSPKQMYGIELDSFGADLAKVTLMISKKLALDEARDVLGIKQEEFGYRDQEALPLDNLDGNVVCDDALFTPWPNVDAIVSNPPYQSKNKIQQELGVDYINRLREQYPDIDGRSDFCVYWLRKAHDLLKPGQRAGMVGTNTIRQNFSRESGLDKIVRSNGTIVEAVSSMLWPDEAAVNVSIVNWIKGPYKGKRRLYSQEGPDPRNGWHFEDRDVIGPSLSFELDVTGAKSLESNVKGLCFQGQTHGHEGFLLGANDAKLTLQDHPQYGKVLFPYLIADELIGGVGWRPKRYVIDFQKCDLFDAQSFGSLFKKVEKDVLPDRKTAAKKEDERNKAALAANPKAKLNRHHSNFLNNWWKLSYSREEMVSQIEKLTRYVACGRVTKRPIFDFVSSAIRPNDALMVFAYEDDYSFGIFQSDIHWTWFVNRCSTLREDFRYTSNTVFDSFPWPQSPTKAQVKAVADAAVELRRLRNDLRSKHSHSLRDIYRLLEKPGKSPLKDAHANLDQAVRAAYGMKQDADPLKFLLELNAKLYEAEQRGEAIVGPGVPATYGDSSDLISKDCLSA